MSTDRGPFADFTVYLSVGIKCPLGLSPSFLAISHLPNSVCLLQTKHKSRHASYTLVCPAWFLLLYFYYCNMLFLLFSLQQLDQLLVEQSHLFSELGLSDWKGERNAQNKQALPDAAGARSGCSERVPQRAASKNTTAAGSLSALQPGAPLTPLPTRTVPEPNSSMLDLQEPSISKEEIKGPPQAKSDFKAFIHNVRSCSSLTLKVVSGRDHWATMQIPYVVPHCHSSDHGPFLLSTVFIPRAEVCALGHCHPAEAGTTPALLFLSKLWQWPKCSRGKNI